jgi:hypothetical protein
LLNQYGLKKNIIYVTDEGSNLNAMTIALELIVKCEVLSLDESFQGICFVHAFFKTCQHATTNEKVCKNLNVFPSSVPCHIFKMYNLA